MSLRSAHLFGKKFGETDKNLFGKYWERVELFCRLFQFVVRCGLLMHPLILLQPFILHSADTQHQFNARESDWGFTSFMPLGELYDHGRGYLVNDTCIIEAEVVVRRVVDYWSYDSKKETGFVGLKNQGATCYMNSLLQTQYHIPYFRKVSCPPTLHIDD